MARESQIEVDQGNTLRLIASAIRAAGGTAGNPIDNQVRAYIKDEDPAEAIPLSGLMLGVFDSDTNSFASFKAKFLTELNSLLQDNKINWEAGNENYVPNPDWGNSTTLSAMSAAMVDDFFGKVVIPPPD